jgi:hypothetical protein
MKQKTWVFAVPTVALILGGTTAGCGGRYAPAGSEETGGSGGSGGTSGNAGNGGSGGSTGGSGGSGGSTGGSGGSTGGAGGSGGSTSGSGGSTSGSGGSTSGSGGSTGGVGGSGGSTGGVGGSGGSTGGTGGSAGKGGAAGSGGTGVPGTIRCGTSICAPITGSPAGTLQPCCPMDTPNACGGISPFGGCLTNTPGMPDMRCPSVAVMGFPLGGCCRPNGMCGVDLQVIGLGCNDPVLVGGMPASRCGNASRKAPADNGASATSDTSAPTSETPAD